MLLNSRELKFLKNYRNVYGKSSASIVMRMFSLRSIDQGIYIRMLSTMKSETLIAKRANFFIFIYIYIIYFYISYKNISFSIQFLNSYNKSIKISTISNW